MSKLDELLQGVDVEWKALGQVCVFRNGFAFKSKLFKDSGLPIVRITNINEDRVDLTNVKFFDINDYKNTNLSNYIVESSDILIAMSGATTGKIGIYESQTISYLNQRVGKFKPNENVLLKKYLYYNLLFKSNFIYELAGGGAQPNLSSNLLMDKFLIPIPCPDNPEKSLEIQQEIVRVLDELTSLTNQLKTELETERQNRKKQFEFFREQLLSFEKGNVEWKTLGDIGNVKMCKRIFKNETKDFGDIPFYKIGTFGKTANAYISRELYEDYKEKYSYPNKGDILISAAGTIGRTVVFDGKPAYFQDSNIIWIENNQETIINEYLCHFYKVAKWYVSGGGTIDRLYNDNVRKTKIPVPFPNDKEKSLAEQKRIVKLLDQFDATHTAIEEEITKEIKLRTQQYEYYREKLLSFPQN